LNNAATSLNKALSNFNMRCGVRAAAAFSWRLDLVGVDEDDSESEAPLPSGDSKIEVHDDGVFSFVVVFAGGPGVTDSISSVLLSS
jgi:hypothetical protein